MSSKANAPTLILNHATIPTELVIYLPNLFGFYYSPAIKATVVVSTATATVPVKETPDEIEMQIGNVLKRGLDGGVLPSTPESQTNTEVQGAIITS